AAVAKLLRPRIAQAVRLRLENRDGGRS
ncbi:hypothetical protein, partial [Cronobacter sakazakii]